MKRNNSGFTMIELLVTVAVSFIVLSALEDLSASGKIYRVEPLSDGWQLQGKDSSGAAGAVLLRYNNGTLRSGGSSGQILLDNLSAAQVDLGGSLVTFTFSTAAHSYSTSVFCRTGIEGDSVDKDEALNKVTPNQLPTELTKPEKDARYAFLKTLAAQYDSRGKILPENKIYFSKWYNPDWNEDTPWCGCFLSWGAAQQGGTINNPPRFANVDNGMELFQVQNNKWWRRPNDANNMPIPGDYVFFDWDGDNDPDHVGAVLCVEGNFLYTIEGNSGGRVAVHRYDLNDQRIVGYGVLDWKTQGETTE